MTSQPIRYVIRFSGHVQGVGFRATTLAVAQGLDINGYVRNESDGSVKVDVDGNESELKELLRRIEAAMSGRIDDTQIDKHPSLERSNGFHVTG